MMVRDQTTSVREQAIDEVWRAMYFLECGREPRPGMQAPKPFRTLAIVAVDTMQRLGWHYA